MSQAPLWITESDVVRLFSLSDAIAALESGLKAEAAGHAASMPKTMLQFGTSNLHSLGGQLGDYVGTKSWAHTDGGTCPLLLLWNANDGQLAAVIEAFALGNLRTGGTSGLATAWMSKPDAQVLAIAGAGKQALSQVAAVLAVRHIQQVRIFSPTETSRTAFAGKVADELGVPVLNCSSIEEACRGADIVTLVTRARVPFLPTSALEKGVHINAVGAIGPDREEFSQDLFDRVDQIAVDSMSGVKSHSREFRKRFDQGDWSEVKPLSEIVANGRRRERGTDLSLFKAMGMGLSDVALAVAILDRARAQDAGSPLPVPVKAKPRLRVRQAA